MSKRVNRRVKKPAKPPENIKPELVKEAVASVKEKVELWPPMKDIVEKSIDKVAEKGIVFEEEPSPPIEYRLLELPRSIFDLSGGLFQIKMGEMDAYKAGIYKELLEQGFKIKSIATSFNHNFLIVFEK